jgi:hypothetical protein
MNKKRIRIKVGQTSIPIYPTNSNGYHGWTVVWYGEAADRQRKFFAKETQARDYARRIATKKENKESHEIEQAAVRYAFADSKLKTIGLTLDSAVRELIEAHKIVGDVPLLQALKSWKLHHDEPARAH